ncbi:MAG: [FeFe] hydrogenase H-cluster radical SAM maturase HydE [Candidatus Omnitrophica bacterium]|nr:[FeFe] hydrogenase H-cluster radical SAM maturase HydE [Candidatus Omnitrophota bacterium]
MTKNEILQLLKKENTKTLFSQANQVRKDFCGDKIFLRGLVEFSSHCIRNCLYCGLRKDNKDAKRTRLKSFEILEAAIAVRKKGLKTVVLQSGDDFFYTRNVFSKIIKNIKKQCPDLTITLSLGERPLDHYNAFYDAGASRYLLKHETADEKLYSILHPGQSLKNRFKILDYLRKVGFQVGSGNIVGLPGQTLDHLAKDILFYQSFQPDMIGIGPFMPQSQTPLANHKFSDISLVLKMIALARIVTKNAHMPVTTALTTLGGDRVQLKALNVGCNVIMPSFTSVGLKKDYIIYDDKTKVTLNNARRIIKLAKRKVSCQKGDSLKLFSKSSL